MTAAKKEGEKVKTKTKASNGRVQEVLLSGDLTLRTAPEVKGRFIAAFASADSVRFSLKDVDEVDLSFVQLLCAAHRMAHERGKALEFAGKWPEPFVNLVREAGLNEHVGCSVDCSVECPWIKKAENNI